MSDFVLFMVIVSVTAGLNTVAQTLLKLGSGQDPINLYLLGGISAYVLSTGFYIFMLKKFDLSSAYPITTGLSVIATAMVGIYFFKEGVSAAYWLGMFFILSGIFIVTFAKNT